MPKGRVIFGLLKHRTIELPDVPTTRPTSDALKEAMFNCLIHRFNINFSEWSVIDVFAGSGALGIEALSLGAPFGLFFEQNPVAYNVLRKNILTLGIKERTAVLRVDVTKYKIQNILPKLGKKILVILDPPYKETKILRTQVNKFIDILSEREFIITVETNDTTVLNDLCPTHILSASGGKKLFIFHHPTLEEFNA